MKPLVKVLTIMVMLASLNAYSQQQLPPVLEWQKSFGGSKADKAYSVIRTLDNGYLYVGYSYSNDGNVTGHHGTTDSSDAWVVKTDANGNLLWQQSYGGTKNDEFRHAVALSNGDFICVGTSSSNNGDVTGLHSALSDLWVIRISSTGSIIWSKLYGGTDPERGKVIRKAYDGGYIIGGDSESNDGDAVGHFGYSDVWILKMNESNGAIIWQKKYGTPFTNFLTSVQYGNGETYLVSGYSQAQGASCINLPIYAWGAALELRLDKNGNALRTDIEGLSCGNPGQSSFSASILQLANNKYLNVRLEGRATVDNDSYYALRTFGGPANPELVYIGGSSASGHYQKIPLTPFFTGPDMSVLLPDSTLMLAFSGYRSNEAFNNIEPTLDLVNLTQTNSLAYHKRWSGNGIDYFTGLIQVGEREFVTSGTSNSTSGDITGNHGDFDFWVAKFRSRNTITGRVFTDVNNNGIKDPGENYTDNVKVISTKGSSTIATFTNASGLFVNTVDTGTYTTTVRPINQYFTVNPISKTSTFTTYNSKDTFDVAMGPMPNKKDLSIDLSGTSFLRTGVFSFYRITYANNGSEPDNVVIRMIIPAGMSFVSSEPVQSSISNDTIVWNGPAGVAERDHISVKLLSGVPPVLNPGDFVTFRASIDPIAGDLTPQDNRDTLRTLVRGAYDPNDKTDKAAGEITPDQLSKNLGYTIRFQNTGNDTAFNVVIKDTLETKLDWNSLQMMDASHPYHLSIKDGNILTWTFPNILLVDSNANEPASHGFITYSVRPKATVIVGDTLKNSASIYFDFNPPVKTNTNLTIVKLPSLITPSVSGVAANYCSALGVQKGKIDNLPASGSGITVTAKLDGNALAIAADSTFSFDVNTLASGSHNIEVTYTQGSQTKSTTLNFNITAAVTPDVNVSANNTTVVNLIDPVMITAANANGGGSSPLYTFGKNASFTSLWQAEGSSNVLNITPSNLQPGDNWVYVRMKTSTTCFTSQFSVDSIKITFALPAPPQPAVSGMLTSYCDNLGVQKIAITNPPAAGTGTTVTVKLDGNTLAIAADNSVSFNVSTLTAGNHTIEVTYTNSTGTKTTTLNFTVTALVTPAVDVTTSKVGINGTEQAVITATSTTGGGQTPTYLFASDRSFTRVLQAEGATSTLTLQGSSLKLGSNWIYVRMRTSSTCFAQQFATDSIIISRLAQSGLTDPDNPGQLISPSPNPFKSQLVVQGLSAAKSYTLFVYNNQGRVLYQRRVTNVTTAGINMVGQSSGTYLLKVYDETKKREIGTVAVVKQ